MCMQGEECRLTDLPPLPSLSDGLADPAVIGLEACQVRFKDPLRQSQLHRQVVQHQVVQREHTRVLESQRLDPLMVAIVAHLIERQSPCFACHLCWLRIPALDNSFVNGQTG